MAVTREEFDHLAKLAHLEFTEDEIQDFMAEFDEMMGFVDMIKTGEASSGMPGEYLQISSLREDNVMPSLPAEKILSGLPENEKENGYFRVGQVVK